MAQTKLITVIGTGRYEPVKYRFAAGSEYETKFFPEAVVRWCKSAEVEVHVLLTDDARNNQNWSGCREALLRHVDETAIHEVPIPDGKNEQELWQIFQAITQIVQDGDHLIIDITHGFRSLPMLATLAVAYLRQVRNATVERILYGAYEARSKQNGSEVAPVFDLTPFVSLLDWLTAAKIFMTTGDGRELAELMENAQNQAFRERAPNPPRQLKSLARSVREVSENLLTSRVPVLAQSTQTLQEKLGDDTLTAEIRDWLPPLVPLFNQIEQRYARFAKDDLSTQLELIRWYEAHGHLVQAYTLAREWLVNYELHKRGLWESRNNKGVREEVETDLREVGQPANSDEPQNAQNVVADLWRRLGDYRNDIAHCGFREHSKPAETLKRDLEQMVETMESLLSGGETP
jgi:CRISPR-associated Csx2 family protein